MARPPTSVIDARSRRTNSGPDGAARPELRTGALSPSQPDRVRIARRLSVVSAGLILAGGYVHFCLYRHGYRFIPKIGVSFLLQATSSAILAAALVLRGGRMRLDGHWVTPAQLVRLSAIGLSVGTLAALGIAHTSGGLFQFREIGLRPAPQTLIAIVVESLAAILLGVAMLEGRGTVHSQNLSGATATPSGRAVREAA